MSTMRPPVDTGFGSCDETVSSCVVVQKNASQRLWIPPLPSSNSQTRSVPATSTTSVSAQIAATRSRRCRCVAESARRILASSCAARCTGASSRRRRLAPRGAQSDTPGVHVRLLVATLALVLAAPAAAATPAQLLRTYAPVVVLHPDEQFPPVAVDGFLESAALQQRGADGTWTDAAADPLPTSGGPWRFDLRGCSPRTGAGSVRCYAPGAGGPPTVYGRYARTRGRVVLQYWLFSTYDFWSGHDPPDDDVWQAHEGDWEAVTLLLSTAGKPLVAGYSRHCSGARRAWAKVARSGGTHPLVYVALGSHSSWFGPGDHRIDTRCYPQAARAVFDAYLKDGVFDRTARGQVLRPAVVRVPER